MRLGNYAASAVLVCGVTVAVVGCASDRGYTKAAQTSASLDDLAAELEASSLQIERTMLAQRNLMNATGDLRRPYERFTKSIDNLEDAADDVTGVRNEFQANRTAYLDAWETQMVSVRSPELRERGEERRIAARDDFRSLNEEINRLKDDYDQLVIQLRDMQRYLNVDLNQESLREFRKMAEDSQDLAKQLQDDIDDVVAQIREMSQRVSPAATTALRSTR